MKKLLRLLSALCMFLIIVNTSYAQTRVFSGNVKDSTTKKGMVGVAVLVKGTNAGTYTDQDGNYVLAVPSNATTIEFRFLGFKPLDQLLGTSNTIDVTMEPDLIGVNQVVVTALGINQEKESLGYATQTVGSDQLNQSGTGNTLDELAGKVAGLNVISSAGDPDAGVYMQLRGEVSLSENNQPLIVVDGIPLDNSLNAYDPVNTFFQASGNGQPGGTGDALAGPTPDNRGIDINPNDIASITVLKGPAASALYGIKAATGAIIITTKRGNGGKKGPTVEFNSSESMSMVNKLPGLQNQYAQGLNGTWVGADGTFGDGTPAGDASGDRKFSWGPAIDTLAWTGTPYTSAAQGGGLIDSHGRIVSINSPLAKTPVVPYDNTSEFFQTGFTEDNNLALSGGNDRSGYRFSIGNVNQTGVEPTSGYDRSNFAINGQTNLSNTLSTSGGLTYITSNSSKVEQGSDISGVMLGLLRTPPTFDDANGLSDPANNPASYMMPDSSQRDYRGGPGYDNPYWSVNRNQYHQDLNRVYGYAQVDYKPLTWLNITYRLGGDEYTQDTKTSFDILSNDVYGSGAIYVINYSNKQINSDLIATLTKTFNKNLSGSLILGQNYFDQTTSNTFQEGTGLLIPGFYDLSNATSFLSSESETEIRRSAWYGEGQLAYKSQLFLTVTGRDETSSTLPANDDVFFYPSADLGWVFTEPLGLSSNKIFPYGKLRLSVAEVGNDAPLESLTTPYTASSSVQDGFTVGDNFPFNGLGGFNISTPISTLGNPDLKPENTTSYEVGLDLAFLQNRISLNGTYYYEHTVNEIFTVPISYAAGWGAEEENAGTLTNQGVELTLNVTPIKQKNNGFRWDLTFNWSTNSNMVNSLAPGVTQLLLGGFTNGGIYAVPGQPFGVIEGSIYQRSDPNNMNSPLLIDDRQTINGAANPGYGMPMESTTGTGEGIIGNIQPNWIGSASSTLFI
jgi:TonB-linked SusC/RagA family outer membrane protein